MGKFYKEVVHICLGECTVVPNRTAGLDIISEESLDTMTGQIHFSSVTYHFWQGKFVRVNNSQNGGPLTKTAVIYFQTSHYLELIALIVNNKNKLLYALNLSAPGQVWGKNIANLWQKLFYNLTFESLYLPCFKRRYIIICSVHLIRKAKGSVQ